MTAAVVNVNFEKNATVKTVVSEIGMSQRSLYEFTCQNKQKIGNKEYVFIPNELLFTDNRFQRENESSKLKIKKLEEGFNENSMDALKVSPHPEEHRFSIIDGYHRFTAGKAKGYTGFPCEVVQGLSSDPEERLIQEATLFATQTDLVENLTPNMKHKANVLIKVKANVVLETLVEKHGIMLKKPTARGKAKIGYLSGFTKALSLAGLNDGEERLDRIFTIIEEARWNLATNGYSKNVISAISNMLSLHEKDYGDILVAYFRNIEPDKFFSESKVKYPERKPIEALTLLLEDKVCEATGIERVYNGGHVKYQERKSA